MTWQKVVEHLYLVSLAPIAVAVALSILYWMTQLVVKIQRRMAVHTAIRSARKAERERIARNKANRQPQCKATHTNMKKEDVYVLRFALVVLATMVVIGTAVEFMVALDMDIAGAMIRDAMWAGAILWTAMAVTGWVLLRKNKDAPSWMMVVLTIVAIGSVVGLFNFHFASFARWANATLSVLFLVVVISTFSQTWRNCTTEETRTK